MIHRNFRKFIILSHIANGLHYINNGINFFMYCLSGPKFRKDLRKVIYFILRTEMQ